MITLTIDGRTLAAEADQTILEAARAAGIDIPTLCWYPKLPIVGNCRICLVSVHGQNKLLHACATPDAERVVVETESVPAVENRRRMLDYLLAGYPGEHLVGIGTHGSNGGNGSAASGNGNGAHPRNEFEQYVVQYEVPARVHHDLPLRSGDERPGDVMIQHDMSTCILCTRCVR